IEESYIQKLDSDLKNVIKKIGDAKARSRESLTKHLKGLLFRRFGKNAVVEVFGSSVTNLSIGTGDLDLCLSFKNKTPRKVLRKISGLLHEEGMEDIQLIPKARIPIVKFKDPRSGLDVDISLDNRLAIYNSMMLKSYAQEERLRLLVQMVKYWASRRGINNAFEGSLSSYAWTLLTIQHAQMAQPPLVPNRQESCPSRPLSFHGEKYDVGFDDEVFATNNTQSLASLLISFFDRFATRWDWDSMVVSIRNGEALSTKSKKWEHTGPLPLEVVTGADDGWMEHVMPIEDPFDHEHDLSRVVRAEGAMSIQNEFMRAINMLSDGKTWQDICEPVFEIDEEPDDLFHDLRNISKDEVASRLEELRAKLEDVEGQIRDLVEERQNSKELLDILRGGLRETRDVRSDRQQILSELRPLSMKVQELREVRDGINQRVAIPTKRIHQEMVRIFEKLTSEVDVFNAPTLGVERGDFAYFFELQAMYEASLKSNEAHQEFIRLRREQNEEYRALKKTKKREEDVLVKLVESNPALESVHLNPKSVKEFQKNAKLLQRSINEQYSSKHELRREIGRLEAWQRISSKKNRNQRSPNRQSRDRRPRAPDVNINEVRQKASSGDSLSLNELDALLSKGGIASIGNSGEQKPKQKRRQSKKRSSQRIDIRQGRTRGRKESRK
ncbi:MAG: nucleotidyltransferase domain-containing protein, partial [Candidatus Poseidoniaceae archaeon]|nr:nucleotidyltransferase domain-containing protein [Candidatus Poseidoniaceae archaeon]